MKLSNLQKFRSLILRDIPIMIQIGSEFIVIKG